MVKGVYDSDEAHQSLFKSFRAFWDYRKLIIILVSRDVSVRYKKSFLGLIWTLLNPLLTSLVFWILFVTVFSARLPGGVPFASYVLAGVIMVTFFNQGLSQAAESIANGGSILTKIFVPPQVFALSGAISNAVNFVFGLIALGLVSLLSGGRISFLAPGTIFVIVFMLFLVTGFGLILAVLYIRFEDTRNIVLIFIGLMMYLTPVFYPKDILSPTVQNLINLNPLTSFLEVFRFVFLGIGQTTLFDWIYMALFPTLVLSLGIRVFTRTWPKTVVML